MSTLLTVLLSFYPTLFLYSTIPHAWMEKIDSLSPNKPGAGTGFFLYHLLVFGVIFYIVFTALRKYTSFGMVGGSKKGILSIAIGTILTLAVATIIFYTILPGTNIYPAPNFIKQFILAEPFTFIILVIPFMYLFFD